LRKAKTRHPEAVFAYMPAWWNLMEARLGNDFFAEKGGTGHGGEAETSINMAIRPELCDLRRAVRQMPDDVLQHGKNVQLIFDISELSTTGATGDPTLASAEKGRRMLDAVVDAVVESIEALEKTDWNYDRRGAGKHE
jgi:creatinine amidohydrolase